MNSKGKGSRIIAIIFALLGLAMLVGLGLWFKRGPEAATSPGRPAEDAAGQGQTADPQAEMQLGALMAQQNRAQDAVAHYREAVRIYEEQLKATPDAPQRLNNLAWLLAANPYAEIRNGKEAVERAKRACELTAWRQAMLVGTLAAAYAETGDYEQAVKTAQRAREIALANGQVDLASRNEQLIKIYREGKPYREPF